MNKRNGLALVISAPSGAGKTTLIANLCEKFPNFGYSISCTTRRPRHGEMDGKDYHFISHEEFELKKNENYFAEWAQVHNNFYGTPLAPIQEMMGKGQDILFDIDVQGAAQLKLTLSNALFVFILPPSISELEKRLRFRNLDDEQTIERRVKNAKAELEQAHWYDVFIINDDLEKAKNELISTYITATLSPKLYPNLIKDIIQS